MARLTDEDRELILADYHIGNNMKDAKDLMKNFTRDCFTTDEGWHKHLKLMEEWKREDKEIERCKEFGKLKGMILAMRFM